MKLLIDIGNTNTSIGVWENSKLSLLSNVINKDLFNILKKYYKKGIDEVLITSVINNKENKIIKDKLKKALKCKITQIKSSSKLFGVINGYKKSAQLGDDRWVTVVASYLNHKKPLVIVDCGTAISIDCVNDNGRHLGGYILSGFDGYSKSFNNAENLKKFKLQENKTNKKLLYAKTTSDGVLSGYALMVCSAIEKTHATLQSSSTTKPLLIMSGGFAKHILSNLDIKAIYDPNLVLKSLGLISERM
mgnify:CR=1 FL=1